MDLKGLLKAIKLNESNISMILGALVIVVVGVLVVNYFRDRGVTIPGISTTNEEKSQTATKKYTVIAGDNLWKIAEKYYGSGYKWTDVAKANNLKNPSVVRVGQELTMPEVSVKTAETKVAAKTEPITGATYTVTKGDNLWKIAVRAYGDGYQWVKISRENKLVHPNLIHSGNVLTIPR